MKHFTELNAWKNGVLLVEEIYRLASLLPKEELYGLTSQIKRSSSSIVANIAEGFGRFTYPDKAAKYIIARGECTETESHLRVLSAIKLLKENDIQKALNIIEVERKLLSGLITACKSK